MSNDHWAEYENRYVDTNIWSKLNGEKPAEQKYAINTKKILTILLS